MTPELAKAIAKHHGWLQSKVTRSGTDQLTFQQTAFTGINFSRTSLAEARFLGCEFIGCNLEGVKLHEAIAEGCTFRDCHLWFLNAWRADFRGSSFIHCKMEYARFEECGMQGVTIKDSDLTNASLARSNLADSTINEYTKLTHCNLISTNLVGAYLPYPIYQVGPIGSEYGYLIYKVGIDEVTRGCFRGTLAEFERMVRKNHRGNYHGLMYRKLIIAFKEARKVWESLPPGTTWPGYIG